jgi:hypothetical protein
MSTDAIKKFLENATQYPDNTPIRIGDTEVPLGSLRALNATERTQLADRMKEIETQKADLNDRQQKIVSLAQKAQEAYNAAEEARKAAAGAPPARPGDDPFADPWLQPVKKELEARDAVIKSLTEQLKLTAGTIVNAATIFSEDRWDREYAAIDFGKREKKPTREEILKFATDNNIVDRHKLPSIRAAWEKMSEADRLKEIAEKAREEGREEGRQQLLASRIPPPGVPGPGQAPTLPKNNPNAADLGDLYADAIKDPELRALLEQLPAGMA